MAFILSLFWSEYFWLPSGYTWNELKSTHPDVYYPKFRDIALPSVLMGFSLTVMRVMLTRFLCYRKRTMFKSGAEQQSNGLVTETKDIFSKEESTVRERRGHDLTLRNSERNNHAKIDMELLIRDYIKYSEVGFKTFFYAFFSIFGLFVLWDKPWFHQTKLSWQGWPKHHVSNDVYLYFLLELAYSWSHLFGLFIDVRRKDFLENIVHHMATCILLYMSWIRSVVRIGTLVLFYHDLAGGWLAGAKLAKYCKKNRLCDFLFGVFVIVWILTRLYFIPTRLLYSILFEYGDYIGFSPGHTVACFLCILLQILHLIWSVYIGKAIVRKFYLGKLNDTRSDSENETEDTQLLDNRTKQN